MIDSRMMALLDEEMDETICLFRKRLEILNEIPADELDAEDVDEIHHIYETLHKMIEIGRDMPAKA